MRTMLTLVNGHSSPWTFRSSLLILRKLCISDLQCFHTFRNSSLFPHFGIYEISTVVMRTMLSMPNKVYIIIFNIPETVYMRYTTFWNFSKLLFENAVCFAHFGFYQISTAVMRTMLTMGNVVQIIISDIPQTVYIKFTMFWNFSNLQFVLHILAITKFILRWCVRF